MLRAAACAFLLLHAAMLVRAEGAESPFFEPLPLVLTPSRLPQSLHDAPAAVSVIDREEIDSLGYRDIPRLLRAIPGMQVGQERGSSHWVTYHGLGNDFPSEMQVLIDGRSVYSPAAFGGVDWLGLPISVEEIDRIEVVRGTDSSAYGANALLGVIAIYTRDPVALPKAAGKATAGSGGIRDLQAALRIDGAGNAWSLHAAHEEDDGFAGLNDSRRTDKVSLRGDFYRDPRHDFSLRLAGNRSRRGLGYPDSLLDNNALRNADSLNIAIDASWLYRPRDDEEWRLRAFQNHDRVDEAWTASAVRVDDANRVAFVPLDRNRESRRTEVELQHRRPLGERTTALWGIGARHDDLDSAFLFYGAPHHDQHLTRAFLNLDWAFAPNWATHASVLNERYSGDRARVSPRLHVNWQVGNHHTLRAGAARAWRQRNLFELYGDIRAIDPVDGATLVRPFVPNPDLRPTRVDSTEVSYLGRFPTRHAQLDVRVFEERLTDFVVRETVASSGLQLLPSSRYANLASPLVLRGIEYQARWQPAAPTTLTLSQALIRRDSQDDAQTRRSAAHTASLRWHQAWAGAIESMATLYRMSPIAGGDGFVPGFNYQTRGYTTLDLSLVWRTRIAQTPLALSLTGTNLGGRHQEIPDRSEQLLHPNSPVNQVSQSLYVGVAFELP